MDHRRWITIAVFVAAAYGLTWAPWIIMVTRHPDKPMLHLLGSLGPAAAAIVTVAATQGRSGLRELYASVTRWRVSRGVWALVVGGPLALYALGVAVSNLLGVGVPIHAFFSTEEFGHVGPALIVVEIIFFGFGEEIGWRGFLLPQLERRGWTPYRASTTFIPIWALWHVPLFLSMYGLGDMPVAMIPGWLMSIALSTYLISWIFHRARQSVAVVAVFHGLVDLVSITSATSTVVLIVVNAGLIVASVCAVTRSRVLFTTDAETVPRQSSTR